MSLASRKLSTNTFTYGGTTYSIEILNLTQWGSSAGQLHLGLGRRMPSASPNAILNVGGVELPLSYSGKDFWWSNTGLSWNVGDSVSVKLTLPAAAKTLGASNVARTSARLTIGGHTTGWWYKRTAPSAGTCTAVASGTSFEDLTGLTPSTSYTYKAYSATGCNTADEIGSATFTTTNPAPPTLTTSVLSGVTYTGSRRTTPAGGHSWNESYTFKSGTALTGAITPGTVTCGSGATAEIGWWYISQSSSDAWQARVGSTTSASGTYTLSHTPTHAGAYFALAYCTAGSGIRKGYSTPVNLMRGGAVILTAPPPPAILGISAPSPAADCPAGPFDHACVKEGESLTVTATLSHALSHDVRAFVEVTPIDSEGYIISKDINAPDYCVPWPSFEITIPAGSTTGTHDLRTYADNDDADASYRLLLFPPGRDKKWPDGVGPSANHTVLLTVKDTVGTSSQSAPQGTTAQVSLGTSPDTVPEGTAVTVTATLSAALPLNVTIPLTLTRVTAERADLGALPPIRIDAGSTTGTSTIRTNRDADGDDETFTVAVDTANLPSNVTAGSATSRTVTITDISIGEIPESTPIFPAAPATLTARTGDRQVMLSWGDVLLATGWEYSKDNGATWTSTGATATSATVTGLTNGTSYRFKVRAVRQVGPFPMRHGSASATATATPAAPSAPTLAATGGATVNAATLTLTFDKNLASASGLTTSAFTVKRNGGGTGETLSGSPSVSGKTVTLTLSTAAVATDTFTVSYAKPTTTTARLRDASDNEVAAFSDRTVTNETPDNVAPTFRSARANGAELVVRFSEPLGSAKAGNGAFDVQVDGARRDVSRYDLSGNRATLTLASAVTALQTVTVAYSKPSSGAVLQDRAGNALASFGAQTVLYVDRNTAPPDKPGRPTGVTATPGAGQVRLAWTAASTGGAVTGWEYRQDSGSLGYGAWTDTGITSANAPTATSYTVTGLTNGTEYTFQVRAKNAGGEGPESAPASATPVSASTPAKPAVTAQAGDGRVTLGWTALAGSTGWQVRRRTVGAWGAWMDIEGSGAATAGHVAAGLDNGTEYGFEVRARNASGYGAASDEDRARPVSATGTAPAAPAGLTATAGDAEVGLEWTAPFDLARSWEYRRKVGGAWGAWTPMTASNQVGETSLTSLLSGLEREYIVGGLANGTAYGFEVRAVNAAGPGTASAEATATPAAPAGGPAKPSGVTATAGHHQVRLGWEAMAGATRWEYQRKAGTGGWSRWMSGVATNAGTATGFTQRDLTNGVQYTYRVRAVDANGPGAASDPVSATPARSTAKPAQVTDLTAERLGETSVRLRWSAQASHHDTVAQWQYRLKSTGAYGEWTDTERTGAMDFTGWTVENLATDTAYTFQVRGRNAVREGEASNEAAVTTAPGDGAARPGGFGARHPQREQPQRVVGRAGAGDPL